MLKTRTKAKTLLLAGYLFAALVLSAGFTADKARACGPGMPVGVSFAR